MDLVNMDTTDIIRFEAPSMALPIAETNLFIEKTVGNFIIDREGNNYYDLTGGSGVANIGYSHPKLIEALYDQIQKSICTGWKTASVLRNVLSERLLKLLPTDYNMVLYTVTGSEAVEGAIKIARAYTRRSKVLGFLGGYHGKTRGSLDVTSRASFKTGITEMDSNNFKLVYPNCANCFIGASYPECRLKCFDFLEFIMNDPGFNITELAAIIIEPIQGAEGIIVPKAEYVIKLDSWCKKNGVVLIFDEIFTGFGRTGKLFCYEHFGIFPDLIVAGKALGGGLPISVTIGNSKILGSLSPYKQTSTFSANALALRAAISVLEIIEQENIVKNAQERGIELSAGLNELAKQFPCIREVRGLGLMIGIELWPAVSAVNLGRTFVEIAQRNGLVLLYGGVGNNILKLTPPLTLTSNDVRVILSKLKEIFSVIDQLSKNRLPALEHSLPS